MITLHCNADFENFVVGASLSTGKAMERARVVARLFSLMGPPGSAVKVLAGDSVEALDADRVRDEARSRQLYDDESARNAPWLAVYGDSIPYAWDARVGRDSKALNSKAFSHRVATEHRLEPGVFRWSRLITSEAELEAHLRAVPDEVRARWTLKPLWGFAGGGRLHGDARGLPPSSRERLVKILARDHAMLFEPWVQRVKDLSAQVLVGESVQLLMQGALFNTEAGRYEGNGTMPEGLDLTSSALLAAEALRAHGYRGVAGVDAFTFLDPVDGKELLRPIVEINARFTLGLITGWMARMHSVVTGQPDTWKFRADWKEPLGSWTWIA